MKDSLIRARIPADLKANAAQVLASCGLGYSEAIRLFFKQVVARNGLPFHVKAHPADLSMAELRRKKQESQARDRRMAALEDASGGEVFLVSPRALQGAAVRWPEAKLG